MSSPPKDQSSSVLLHFYKKGQEERIKEVARYAKLTDDEVQLLRAPSSLSFDLANRMIENVVGSFPIPLAYATNFRVNGKDYLVPMVIEEASVVAAASNSAKLARAAGGFEASGTEPLMISQIQVVGIPDMVVAKERLMAHADELVKLADEVFPSLKQFGGGAKSLSARELNTKRGPMLIVHLVVNVKDAMGANSVNSMAEGIAPRIEELTGGKVRLRILTNLAVLRLFKSRAVWKKELLAYSTGLPEEQVVDAVLDAWAFADADPFRATTHNKGIMNGISAVAVATGNDWRAVEAGAHSFASYNRTYTSLTRYWKNENGDLVGEIELPLALGRIGGATSSHPLAKVNFKILNCATAQEFSMVVASVGLAQNFAALRALATEGIQRGHMKLHAKNIAIMAGATGDMIEIVAKRLTETGRVDVLAAKKFVEEQRRAKL